MPPPKPASRGEYIETETGNKISRRASILGTKHIILAGKCVIQHDVVVHGDLVRPAQPKPPSQIGDQKSAPPDAPSIHLGRYVFVSPGCTLHPPSRVNMVTPSDGGTAVPVSTYYPLRISDYVFIGQNTHVRAAEIKSNVYIGANCNIGNMVIIRENVKILDGTVLPANSVWASGSIVAGRPGRVVGELGDAWTGGGGSAGAGIDEGVGVRSRERWAAVGNKK